MDVCTIVAKNYLAHARVLARSLAAQHPDVPFHVLVIDDPEGYVDPASEPFELITIDQLGIERFSDMAVMYGVLELSTAVKPWLLRHLLARSQDSAVVYLDPDMRVYAPLDEMFDAVRRHGLVLSPHNLSSMPRDGRKPSEHDILGAGVYNLGFVGINAGAFADELLDWWAVRLERDCIVDPARGYFVDQRWMDFAPGMAESFHLLRDPGFNVAYWNLHARPVSQRDGTWWVDGDAPLRLFHFSGYDLHRPETLSKHQDRIELEHEPALRQLCDEYAEALRAEGVEQVSELPYTYATMASGIALDAVSRRMYRKLVLESGWEASPFDPDGEEMLLYVLNAPARNGGGDRGVTRYLEELYGGRPDLQRIYPDLDGAGAGGLIAWAHQFGRVEIPIDPALLPPLPDVVQAAAPVAVPRRRTERAAAEPALAPRLGVNVAGYLSSEMGVGEVARQVTGALDAVAIPALPVGITAPRGRHGHAFAGADAGRAGHPINLVCVNADMLPGFAADVGEAFFADRYTIGWWWWEVSSFPDRWNASFELVDEVWVGSRFVADALAGISPVPVVHMPLPVTLPGHPQAARGALGLPAGFVFLFVYDYNSIMERKNPVGVLDAFLRAFPDPGEGVSLVLKSINAHYHPEAHGRLESAAAGHPHVRLLEQFLSPAQKNQLIASCDAYVSLHRSEGFGITLAEAMLMGKPVVATGYSGNTDFMTEENSWPVRYAMRPIGLGSDPYPAEGEWADPDLEHAAACLREVFEHPGEVARRGARAARDLATGHSRAAAGQAMAARLQTLPLYAAGDAEELDRVARRLLDVDTSSLHALRELERRLATLETRLEAPHARIDVLAGRMDALADEQRRQGQTLRGTGLYPGGEADLDPAGFPQAPDEPWTHEYNAAHRGFVARELDDPALLDLFRSGEPLPEGFGVGFDERVVEFPWVAAQPLGGRVLDAGSTLNHLHVLTRLRLRMDALHIVTLKPEADAFPQLDVSYLYADLRDLPLADGVYDRVVSISTLEHVGMDNAYYGSATGAAPDPQQELLAAVRELRRVLRPGGDCYITVPAGSGERFAWLRTLTGAELDEVVGAFAPERHSVAYYRYTGEGWQVSDREAVAGETYRDHFSSGPVGPDRAVAARAVACLHLVKPAA